MRLLGEDDKPVLCLDAACEGMLSFNDVDRVRSSVEYLGELAARAYVVLHELDAEADQPETVDPANTDT